MESKRSEEELKAREKKINVSNNNNKNHPPLPKSSKQWTLTYIFAKLWLIILLRGNYFYRFIHSFIYLLTYLVNVFTEHLLCIRYLIIPQEFNYKMTILPSRSAQIGVWGTGQGQGRLTEKQIITRQSDYGGDRTTEGVVVFGHTRKALKKEWSFPWVRETKDI